MQAALATYALGKLGLYDKVWALECVHTLLRCCGTV